MKNIYKKLRIIFMVNRLSENKLLKDSNEVIQGKIKEQINIVVAFILKKILNCFVQVLLENLKFLLVDVHHRQSQHDVFYEKI